MFGAVVAGFFVGVAVVVFLEKSCFSFLEETNLISYGLKLYYLVVFFRFVEIFVKVTSSIIKIDFIKRVFF